MENDETPYFPLIHSNFIRQRISINDNKTIRKCFIDHGNNSQMIEQILRSFGYERQYQSEGFSHIQWLKRVNSKNWNSFENGKQLINHIQGEDFFTTKLQLYQSLESYAKIYSSKSVRPKYFLELNKFVPETFKIDEKFDRQMFTEIFQNGQFWICKSSEMNRGEGIYLIRNEEEFNSIIEQQSKSNDFISRKSTMKRIVQRYIERPLLINKKKFDIRCFMLIANVDPLIVFYNLGYLRLSIFDFDLNDRRLETHLTNQSVQKHDENYKTIKEETIMTIEQFSEYIIEHLQEKYSQENLFQLIKKRIESIIVNIVDSVRMRLNRRIGCFGLYGLDLMIDQSINVWLIEINVNPSLSTNNKKLSNILPELVRESLALSIECFDKVRRFQSILPLINRNKFELVYREIERRQLKSTLNKVHQEKSRSISNQGRFLIKDKINQTRQIFNRTSNKFD